MDSGTPVEGGLVCRHNSALPLDQFEILWSLLSIGEIPGLYRSGFDFYRATFWVDLQQKASDPLETCLRPLFDYVDQSGCEGVEWWLSVQDLNRTPYWLLKPHFDRDDISHDVSPGSRFPKVSSVFFLDSLPYGELIVTDQRYVDSGVTPKDPGAMCCVRPEKNLYAAFSGSLMHGVIGRMWRQRVECPLRIALALNYWEQRPTAGYMKPCASYGSTLSG